MSDGGCHFPTCPHPRVTLTMCAYHAAKLLIRPPEVNRPAEVEKPPEVNRKAA